MAIDAATIWEVRASGSSVNGGGFVDRDPGTSVDYSQQDAAQLSVADLATDGAGTGLSSVTGGFTAAMAGNVIQISGGTLTAGWYEITAYTDTNNVTIDRSAGLTQSGSTGNVGGAFDLGTALDDEFVTTFTDGNTCYIESGSYTLAETVISTNAASPALPIDIIGYITTRSTIPYGDDRPLIDCGASYYWGLPSYWRMKNVRLTGSYLYVFYSVNGYVTIVNCKVTNTSGTAGRSAYNATNVMFIGCEGVCTNGKAFSGISAAICCYAHDSVTGFSGSNATNQCIMDTCSTYGITTATTGLHSNNTIYNCGTGFYLSDSTADSYMVVNTLIDACTTGFDAVGALHQLVMANCVIDATTPIGANLATCTQIGNLTADPAMTDPANGDFSVGTGSNAYKTGFDITDYIAGITV